MNAEQIAALDAEYMRLSNIAESAWTRREGFKRSTAIRIQAMADAAWDRAYEASRRYPYTNPTQHPDFADVDATDARCPIPADADYGDDVFDPSRVEGSHFVVEQAS
jgi:hypothetical protein